MLTYNGCCMFDILKVMLTNIRSFMSSMLKGMLTFNCIASFMTCCSEWQRTTEASCLICCRECLHASEASSLICCMQCWRATEALCTKFVGNGDVQQKLHVWYVAGNADVQLKLHAWYVAGMLTYSWRFMSYMLQGMLTYYWSFMSDMLLGCRHITEASCLICCWEYWMLTYNVSWRTAEVMSDML